MSLWLCWTMVLTPVAVALLFIAIGLCSRDQSIREAAIDAACGIGAVIIIVAMIFGLIGLIKHYDPHESVTTPEVVK